MTNASRLKLEALIGQLIWEGRLYTRDFDVYSEEGRAKAKKWLVEEINAALKP